MKFNFSRDYRSDLTRPSRTCALYLADFVDVVRPLAFSKYTRMSNKNKCMKMEQRVQMLATVPFCPALWMAICGAHD